MIVELRACMMLKLSERSITDLSIDNGRLRVRRDLGAMMMWAYDEERTALLSCPCISELLAPVKVRTSVGKIFGLQMNAQKLP